MFCRQCEQTQDHFACVTVGVCGKTSETAACQDALMQQVKSVASACVAARAQGLSDESLQKANVWTLAATFSTLTNVNFSDARIADYILEGQAIKDDIVKQLKNVPEGAKLNLGGKSVEELEEYGHTVSVPVRAEQMNHEDAFSLNEMATYGMKGVCAYAMHCHQLGSDSADVMAAVHEVFDKLGQKEADFDGLLAAVMRVGQINAQVLSMLDAAHAGNFGNPEPTQVLTTAVEGHCILVSGHDLKDLYELLKQTEGKGINVYTHGEMLPAHSYPLLKQFKHLVGNYGTAWQNQKFEFAGFPGPIIVTTK
jgi:hydroxylamine reductase